MFLYARGLCLIICWSESASTFAQWEHHFHSGMKRYKNFLSKPFSKVELFLCLEADFLREFNNQDAKNNTRNEQIIDIDDEDVDDIVLLPFPSSCTEGITTTAQGRRRFKKFG